MAYNYTFNQIGLAKLQSCSLSDQIKNTTNLMVVPRYNTANALSRETKTLSSGGVGLAVKHAAYSNQFHTGH